MNLAPIIPITKDTSTHTYHQHVRNMDEIIEEDFFEEFKQKIETDSAGKLAVMPRTRKYKMSIFDVETGILQAYFNFYAEMGASSESWRVLPSNTYLQLILPYYNEGTHHL